MRAVTIVGRMVRAVSIHYRRRKSRFSSVRDVTLASFSNKRFTIKPELKSTKVAESNVINF